MKSTPFKTRKISPLDLLSKVTKLDKISSEFDLVCVPVPKMNSTKMQRYNTQPKHEDSLPEINGQPIKTEHQEPTLSKQKRIESSNQRNNNKLKAQKSQSQKYRYYSVQKQLLKKSPYNSQVVNLNQQRSNYSMLSKIKRRKDIRRQIKCESLMMKPQQAYKNSINFKRWELNTQSNLKLVVMHHYHKIKQIYKVLLKQNKVHQKILDGVRNYILQQIDSSQLQNLYTGQQSRLIIRKIIYFERLLILLLTQTIVSKKYLMHHHNFQSIFNIYLQFYANICFDLNDQKSTEEPDNKTTQVKQTKFSYHNAHSQIQSKLKTVSRHSKWLNGILQRQTQKLHKLSPNMMYYQLLEHFSICLLHEDCSQWKIQFLQTCPSPYLHYQSDKQYTLVLDLDQTLIHYKMSNAYNGQFLIRPYLYDFLRNLSEYYEIGVFTCSLPEYADLILNHLQHISFRLYRHHTVQIHGEYVKDLSRIGRDLSKVILVDNLDKNFRLQKQNGIHIKSWYGDRKDNWLVILQNSLKSIIGEKPQDIRLSKHKRSFL